jgi:hypothetical protein
MHPLFYTDHVTNACKQWRDVLARGDEWAAAWGVGNSVVRDLCVSEDNAKDQEGIQRT